MACCCGAGSGQNAGGRRRRGACPGTDRFFTREAPKLARRFCRRGPEPVQRKLLAALAAAGVGGASVLELGCGTGYLHRRLLAAGAATAVGVDVAHGMIAAAAAAARRAGLGERVTLLTGDAVERASDLPPAELVLLDKVLCCYPDLGPLLATALPRCRRLLAVVIPRPNLVVAALWRVAISLFTLFGANFHPFYHDWRQARATITAAGFRRVFADRTLAWETWVFQRRPAG